MPHGDEDRCDWCSLDISGTPYAFPISDLRFEECLRFCGEGCLEAYREDYEALEADEKEEAELFGAAHPTSADPEGT